MPSSATTPFLQGHFTFCPSSYPHPVWNTRAMKDLEVVCQKYYFVNWRSHGNIKLQHSFCHKTNLSQLLPLKHLWCGLKVDFSTRIEVHWRSHKKCPKIGGGKREYQMRGGWTDKRVQQQLWNASKISLLLLWFFFFQPDQWVYCICWIVMYQRNYLQLGVYTTTWFCRDWKVVGVLPEGFIQMCTSSYFAFILRYANVYPPCVPPCSRNASI